MGKRKFDLTKDMIGDISIPNLNQVNINDKDEFVNLEKKIRKN